MHRTVRTHQIPDYDSQVTSAVSYEGDDVCNEDVSACVCWNCHVWTVLLSHCRTRKTLTVAEKPEIIETQQRVRR